MSFTDNSNGTVMDNNTGLMWQEEDDGIAYNWYQANGTFDATYNPSSQNVCGSLTLGDHSDWRLPTRKELMSIVDYGIPCPGPTIDMTYFPNTKSSYYWTSTPYINYWTFPPYLDYTFGWALVFFEGDVFCVDKYQDFYVRCVRGGQYPSRNLIDNGNGTITDNATGLIWQQEWQRYMAWGSALSYCKGLSLGGRSDWRLPNIRELDSLTGDGEYYAYCGYWSSTTNVCDPNNAWHECYQSVGNGVKQYNTMYARCVRGGETPSDGSSILITKYARKSQINSGAQAIFDITIENNGETPLVNIEIKDDQCDELKADKTNNNNYLAIGDKLKYTCIKKYVTRDLTNIAAVKAVSINGTVVTSSATATVKVDNGLECDPSLYENICDKKGQVVTGFYIIAKKERKEYDCNYGDPDIVVIDKQVMPNGDIKCVEQGIVGNINSDCLGRCGAGCGWDLFDVRYTQECLNHDLCTRSTGKYLGPCKTEFDIAQEGWTCAEECPE
jgi:hypothetical protein